MLVIQRFLTKKPLRRPGKSNTKYVKQSGGRGQYAHVSLEIEPNEPGKGIEVIDKIVGGVIPKEYIPAVIKGIKEGLTSGVLAGYQLIDVIVRIVFGSYHDVDSNEMAFKICGSMAVKAAAKEAGAIILEPIMSVNVVTPEINLGDVIGDLNKRRGKILSQAPSQNACVIESETPLSEMFGYSTTLRSITSGRANYSMEPHSFQKVPKKIQEEIIGK